MSPGELAVWAAEYVRVLGEDHHPSTAARAAGDAVRSLRHPATRGLVSSISWNNSENLAMLAEVLARPVEE